MWSRDAWQVDDTVVNASKVFLEIFWWTSQHRVITIMRRLQRFFQRHRRRIRQQQHQQATSKEEKIVLDIQNSLTPNLPGAIWVTQVLPYLDRVSQNRLCATCVDIYKTSQQFHTEMAWPEGKFRFKRPILAVAFSPDAQVLAIVPANSKTILLWNRKRGMDQTLRGHGGIVSNVTFHEGSGTMASCSRTDGTIRIWNRNEATQEEPNPRYQCTKQLILRVFAMRFLRFSPCGEMLAVWGNDRMIRLEKVYTGPPSNVGVVLWRSRLGIKCCESVVFPKQTEQKQVVYTFNNEQVRVWNYESQSVVELRDQERTIRVGYYDSYVTAMKTIDLPLLDGSGEMREYLVVGCRVAMLKLWDLSDYSCVRSFFLGNGWSAVTNITFAPDGRTMACTGEGSQIRVFEVETAKCITVLTDHKERVESMSISPDGQTLVSGACDRTVRLWSMPKILSASVVS